ncbi:MAG: ribonuclease H-like domain-containing protein [Gallintestinimicrobium sp.]
MPPINVNLAIRQSSFLFFFVSEHVHCIHIFHLVSYYFFSQNTTGNFKNMLSYGYENFKKPYFIRYNERAGFFFEAPQDILFFDIETTGFSARSACVYLIGCAYLTTNGWETRQFFAETPDDEADVLQQFFPFPPPFRSWYILTEQPSMFRFCRPARKNSGFLLSRRPSSTTSTKNKPL